MKLLPMERFTQLICAGIYQCTLKPLIVVRANVLVTRFLHNLIVYEVFKKKHDNIARASRSLKNKVPILANIYVYFF